MARNTGAPRRLGSEAARRAFSVGIVKDVVSELRRVTWPSREETARLTLMVIGVSVAIGIFLGLVDIAFARLFEFVLGS